MSRMRSLLGRFAAALALCGLTGVAACSDDGKTAPARCLDPALPLFDPAHAGAPSDDNARYVGTVDNDDDPPCITLVGHAVSYVGEPPSNTAGTSGVTPGAGGAGGGGAGAGGEGGGGD